MDEYTWPTNSISAEQTARTLNIDIYRPTDKFRQLFVAYCWLGVSKNVVLPP